MSFLQLKDLHIKLGEFALKGVSLDVEKGDYLTVMGPTGAGKTILLECIVGFYQPDKGRIFIDDQDITLEPPEKRRVGIVYQDYALLPHLSVFKNIEYGLKKVDRDKNSRRKKIQEMAEALQIDHLLHRRPGTMSGGEQQRTALARALVVEPRMLLMDEPLSALDPSTRHNIRKLLRRVLGDRRITVLHITHDMDDVWALADNVAILKNGRLLQHDTLSRVLYRPADKLVADFVGATVFEGRFVQNGDDSGLIRLGKLHLRTTDRRDAESNVQVAIRPENVLICREPPNNSAAGNIVQATLQDIRHNGVVSYLYYQADGVRIPALVTTSVLHEMNLQLNQRHYLSIHADHVKIV